MGRAKKILQRTDFAVALAAQFRLAIPKNEDIVREALREVLLPFEGDVEQVKANVSAIIVDSEARAHQKYKDAQRDALARALKVVLGQLLPSEASGQDAVNLIASNAEGLDQFFLSVSQGRKSRAGAAVETFFDTLFRGMGYPFEREHVVNGTPDFVFPSVIHFEKLPTDCIIFTCKRTLRERWRQITSEGSRGFVLFLGTLDATVLPADLEDMKQQKIVVVIPEQIRAVAYGKVAHVISVESFLSDYLDPAVHRWRRNKIIP